MNQRAIYAHAADLEKLADDLDSRIGKPVVAGSSEVIRSLDSLKILGGNGNGWHAIAVVNTEIRPKPTDTAELDQLTDRLSAVEFYQLVFETFGWLVVNDTARRVALEMLAEKLYREDLTIEDIQ